MTDNIQNGEGVEAAARALLERPYLSDVDKGRVRLLISAARHSLAREPATADVEREAIDYAEAGRVAFDACRDRFMRVEQCYPIIDALLAAGFITRAALAQSSTPPASKGVEASDESSITDAQINDALRHGFGDRIADAVLEDDLVTLAECEPGLFLFNGTLCFKSEYTTTLENPRRYQCDAYAVESGEYFHGGTAGDVAARSRLMVRPIAYTPTPSNDTLQGRGEVEERERILRAVWAELDRQAAIGAGEWHTCAETGLMCIDMSVDPHAFAAALQKDTRHDG